MVAAALVWAMLPIVPVAAGVPEPQDLPPQAVNEDGDLTVVVRTAPGVDSNAVLPAQAARAADVALERPLDRLNATTVDVPPDEAQQLLEQLHNDPLVEYAEIDTPVELDTVDGYLPHQWGLHITDIPELWDDVGGGSGVTVAVLDTGVDAEVAEIPAERFLEGYDFIQNAPGAPDAHGHGTMSATVIAAERGTARGVVGACYECTILPVKVLSDSGSGTMSGVAAGIVWAADNGADVVNMSLGGASTSSLVQDAVQYAKDKGVVLLASAGNDGNEQLRYPASYAEVIAVAGSTSDDTRYAWSTYGAATDIAAPGCNVSYNLDEVAVWYCGTSSAAPVASAVAAIALQAAPDASPQEIRSALESSAVDVGQWAAAGRIDAPGAVDAVSQEEPDESDPPEDDPPEEEPPTATLTHLVTSSGRVNAGSAVKVKAKIDATNGSAAGHHIDLQARPSGGSWTTIDTKKTASNGEVALSGVPDRTSQLRVRSKPFDSTLTSAAGSVEVQAKVSFARDRSRVQAGERVVVSGTVHPKVSGQPVQVQQSYGSGWTTLTTAQTSSKGTFSVSIRPDIPGQSKLRVRVPSTSAYVGTTSGSASLTITVAPRRPGGQPVVGDFNGDGRVTPGWYDDGRWTLQITRTRVRTFNYGRAGDTPLVGDWNGDGRDTVGIVRDGEWHLRNDVRGGAGQIVFTYGRVTRGDVPLVGDWNGDGQDTIGIVRDGEWHLRNALRGGRADMVFTYGRITRGDVPLVGDWNGDGQDTIGIVRDGEWHIRDSLRGGAADRVFTYGRVLVGDVPTVGDWNGDGRATPAIVRDGEWHLRNTLRGGAADIVHELP